MDLYLAYLEINSFSLKLSFVSPESQDSGEFYSWEVRSYRMLGAEGRSSTHLAVLWRDYAHMPGILPKLDLFSQKLN